MWAETAGKSQNDERNKLRYRTAALTVSALIVLLGICAIAGWLLEVEVIVSVVPDFPAMAFNTALCFILSGLALAGSVSTRRQLNIAASVFAVGVITITLIRFSEILTLGRTSHLVDRVLTNLLVSQQFSDLIGGGMGPNTALIFLIGNIALFATLNWKDERAPLAQELTSYIAITLGMIAFAAYITSAEHGYRWGPYAAMALHTSIGMMVFGGGLLASAWWRQPQGGASVPLWIPGVVCFTGLLADLYTPLGVANGILYVPLVLTALWFGNRKAPLFFAFVCTILILLGFFAVSHEDDILWPEIANRAVTIAMLWLIAYLVHHYMRNSASLETERIRFSSLVRNTPDAVITMDERGVISSFNPAAEQMFGYTPAEALGKNIKMLMPEPYHSEHDGYLSRYRETSEERIIGTTRMVSGRRKNGSAFPLDLSVSVVPTGGSRTFVGIVRDISERIRQEERLKSMVGQLEAYTADLERSNQDLDEFAYIASHDLKEPLRGLHNHSRFLLEDYETQLDEDGVRRLNRLVRLSQRMEKLVNDLLYFSRIGRQQLAVKRTEINLVIKDVVGTLEVFLEERNAHVTTDGQLPEVVCDATRLTEVFRNLVTNAVKYNDKAEPLVTIGYLDHYRGTDGAVASDVFFVRDNGKGIAPEFYEDIFRIFKRLEKSQDSDDGTGAGLTFVRKIITRHNGEIWLESELGTGTTFYFTLGSKREGHNAAA